MKPRYIFGTLSAAVLLATFFSGCTKIEQAPDLALVPVATQTTSPPIETLEEVTSDDIVAAAQYDEISLRVPEITPEDFSVTVEAEETEIPDSCNIVDEPRANFSGDGYVSGLSTGKDAVLTLSTSLPQTQHYDITIVAATNAVCTCEIVANGETVYTLILDSTEDFVRVTVQGIFLSAGECTLEFVPVDGIIDVDCVEIDNNTSLYDESSEISAQPVNENASAATRELYSMLFENYGSKMITGQYVTSADNSEMDEIYRLTGKYPLIRFDDIAAYTQPDATPGDIVTASIDWTEQGGIVGLCWYWSSPTDEADSSIYASKTDFSLENAVTDEDIACLDMDTIWAMQKNGDLSAECVAIIQDIDAIADILQPLADADVPVLWRPLMEAGGGWYWWGEDPDAYRWLWELLFTRLTDYHHLNNLIWIWNGQSSNYLVDSDLYDIASLDLYLDDSDAFGSRYEQYVSLRNMTSGKMLALSECSTVPDMNSMFRDNAVWSFFGLWYAPYLGEVADEAAIIETYNSEAAITLEIP